MNTEKMQESDGDLDHSCEDSRITYFIRMLISVVSRSTDSRILILITVNRNVLNGSNSTNISWSETDFKD